VPQENGHDEFSQLNQRMSAADIQRPASKLKFGGLTEYRGEEFPHSNSRTVQSRVKIELA